MSRLANLDLSGCLRLESLTGLPRGSALKDLNINQCSRLKNVDDLAELTGLETLGILSAQSANFGGLKALTDRWCKNGVLMQNHMVSSRTGRPRSPALQFIYSGKPILKLH